MCRTIHFELAGHPSTKEELVREAIQRVKDSIGYTKRVHYGLGYGNRCYVSYTTNKLGEALFVEMEARGWKPQWRKDYNYFDPRWIGM